MEKIEFTKSLIYNKAIIIKDDQECPKGYIEISGYTGPKGRISIAVPEQLMKSPKVLNMLSDQAEACLLKAFDLEW